MKKSPIFLTTAALLMAGVLTPRGLLAAAPGAVAGGLAATAQLAAADEPPAGKAPDEQGASGATDSKTSDDNTDDIEAKLEAARARLQQAAHEVAELSTQMSKPFMDKFFLLSGEGPPRVVIGVQLDTASGRDGARIEDVSPGGPAAEAGLRAGDVIVGINGSDVKGEDTARQVLRLMHDVAPESKVKVRVLREGKPQEFTVTARRGMGFMSRPAPPRPPGFSDRDFRFDLPTMIHGPLADMELATLTPQLGRYFGTEKGVLVVRAPKEEGFKLQDGDVILAIDGREPTSGSHATRILSSYQPGEKISLRLMREHKTINVETTLDERQGPQRKLGAIRKEGAPT